MSLHLDTLITIPHGFVPLSQISKHSIIYNLSTKEHIVVEDVSDEEVDIYMSIYITGLKPLLCSQDQMIATSEGYLRASDLCTACKVITGLGARSPYKIDYIPSPTIMRKIFINSTTPTFLANGIYVVAERRVK